MWDANPADRPLIAIKMDLLLHLIVALAIGLLIGLERGWKSRGAPEGTRVAGLRTFGLIGFLGGLCAVLSQRFNTFLLAFAFTVLAALLIFAHKEEVKRDKDVGITTVVAALVTFALGAIAVLNQAMIASAGAVLVMALLNLKPVLHLWLQRLEYRDLIAVIKLLLISVVVLPALPNTGYGPWSALNPYQIWWMVILIAVLSFAGYIAMKAAGTRRGLLLTGAFGGMVSSTLVTLNFSRLAAGKDLGTLIPAGIVLASAVMLPRMAVEISVVNILLLPRLALPLALMTLVSGGAALWLARQPSAHNPNSDLVLNNPMELLPAIKFGLLLTLIMLVTKGMYEWLGTKGLYLTAAISGISDVDAITMSLAKLAHGGANDLAASRGIVIAALVNTLFKGGIAIVIGGRAVARYVLPIFALTTIAGIIGLFLMELT